MRIYFTASAAGKEQYGDEYRLVINTLKDLGSQVSELVFDRSLEEAEESPAEKDKLYQKMSHFLKAADLVVAEISYPSVTVGYEISRALSEGKPVLALRFKGTRSNLLEGHPDEKFKMTEYEKGTLKTVLEQWIKSTSDLVDVRFNFFVSPKIINYLDWIAKEKRIPRAVYLRDLLEREMKKNPDYKKKSGEPQKS